MSSNKNVTLISSDNMSYEIPEEVAIQNKLIKAFLNPAFPFVESIERTFPLPIVSNRLERVIEYLRYKEKYKNVDIEDVPEFPVNGDEALDLLEISAYLQL